MAEELTQEQKDALATADAAKKLEEEKQAGIMIPKARLDEVLEEARQAKEKLALREAADQKAAEEKLAAEGKTKELLEIREKEIASLRIDGLKRDLVQDAINNQKLHPKLAKMVTGSTEEEIKKSLEEAIEYQTDIDAELKKDKTATDLGGGQGGTEVKPMSTQEYMELYNKDPKAADEYLRKLTEQKNKK